MENTQLLNGKDSKMSPIAIGKQLSDLVRARFTQKITQILQKYYTDDILILNNIWMFNQVLIPFNSVNNSTSSCGNLKIRYGTPENEASAYASTLNNRLNTVHSSHILEELVRKQNDEIVESNFSLDINTDIDLLSEVGTTSGKSTAKILQKTYVHTCFASNHLGYCSTPMVVFPQKELETNIPSFLLTTTHVEETPNGDLNDLEMFVKWLKLFYNTNTRLSTEKSRNLPTILLVSSYLYVLLFKSSIPGVASKNIKNELTEFCKEKSIFILFCPIEPSTDALNQSLFLKFKEKWAQSLLNWSIKDNPHTQKAFLLIIKQALRLVYDLRYLITGNPMKDCLIELFSKFNLDTLEGYSLEKLETSRKALYKSAVMSGFIIATDPSNGLAVQSDYNSQSSENRDQDTQKSAKSKSRPPTEISKNRINQSESNDENCEETNNYAQINVIPKLTEQETSELITWINQMSKIGCLCLKFTFIRELYLKHRPNNNAQGAVRVSEKRWIELITKNKQRIHPNSCGLDESNYFLRWFDEDYWRMEYFNSINQHNINSANSLWTFDIIHFPYSPTTGMLRQPEKDHEQRPRNFKPCISVIFAFNAAGDYIQPFFIYPLSFKTDEESPSVVGSLDSASSLSNESFSQNGNVTSRVFEKWLTECFFPYLSKDLHKTTNLLMYCGKLAVMDELNLKLCQTNNLQLFNISHEKQMPFNLLFQKSSRNRQTDLFLDSWRKATIKHNLNFPMKCKSRLKFFNIFMDAFQNCIEEIGNSSQSTNSSSMDLTISPNKSFSTTSVSDFRNKMVNSFYQCQLWPINNEEYAKFVINAKAKLVKFKSSDNELIIEENAMDVDPNNIQDYDEKVKPEALNENNNVMNKLSHPDLKRLKQTAETSDSEKLNSLSREFNSDDMEDSDTEHLDDITETNFKDSELNGLEDSVIHNKDRKESDDESFNLAKKAKSKRAYRRRGSKASCENLLKKMKKNSGKMMSGSEASLKMIISDLLWIIVKKYQGLDEVEKGVSYVPQIISKRIIELGKSCKYRSELIELLIQEFLPVLAGENTSQSCEDVLDKQKLEKSVIFKELVDSLCNFYINKSYEKLKIN